MNSAICHDWDVAIISFVQLLQILNSPLYRKLPVNHELVVLTIGQHLWPFHWLVFCRGWRRWVLTRINCPSSSANRYTSTRRYTDPCTYPYEIPGTPKTYMQFSRVARPWMYLLWHLLSLLLLCVGKCCLPYGCGFVGQTVYCYLGLDFWDISFLMDGH